MFNFCQKKNPDSLTDSINPETGKAEEPVINPDVLDTPDLTLPKNQTKRPDGRIVNKTRQETHRDMTNMKVKITGKDRIERYPLHEGMLDNGLIPHSVEEIPGFLYHGIVQGNYGPYTDGMNVKFFIGDHPFVPTYPDGKPMFFNKDGSPKSYAGYKRIHPDYTVGDVFSFNARKSFRADFDDPEVELVNIGTGATEQIHQEEPLDDSQATPQTLRNYDRILGTIGSKVKSSEEWQEALQQDNINEKDLNNFFKEIVARCFSFSKKALDNIYDLPDKYAKFEDEEDYDVLKNFYLSVLKWIGAFEQAYNNKSFSLQTRKNILSTLISPEQEKFLLQNKWTPQEIAQWKRNILHQYSRPSLNYKEFNAIAEFSFLDKLWNAPILSFENEKIPVDTRRSRKDHRSSNCFNLFVKNS